MAPAPCSLARGHSGNLPWQFAKVFALLLAVACGTVPTTARTTPSAPASVTAEEASSAPTTETLPTASAPPEPTAASHATTAAPATTAATSAPPATSAPAAPVSAAPTPSPIPSQALSPSPSLNPVAARGYADRPDDFAGPQIHFMYILPSDGQDEQLDVNGAIANSVASIQTWLAAQTGGRRLRVDTFKGQLDVTFFRLRETDAQMIGAGPYVRDRIEAELTSSGMTSPNKLYGVFYGGGSSYACGGGAWPPVLPGIVAVQYLKGTPQGVTCASNPVGASASSPGYEDFAMLHELLHTMGLVAACAPHFSAAGHVSDDPRDLMYAGPLPWRPALLDVGHDDYYGHTNAGCLDLAKLPWLG